MAWCTSFVKVATVQAFILAMIPLSGCRASKIDPKAEAPPPTQVDVEGFDLIQVEHPENFPVVRAIESVSKLQMIAIGKVVSNDSLSVATVSSGANHERLTDLWPTWIECDVYRSDIAGVKLGAVVEIRPNSEVTKTFPGRIAAISTASGATLERAKVRIATSAPELIPGTFVIAAFPSYRKQVHAALPESAILNFRDRYWVYIPAGEKAFRRVEVLPGNVLPHDMQEIVDGIQPTESVVQNPRNLLRSLEP